VKTAITAATVNPLAGKVAPASILVNVTKLIAAYYIERPEPDNPQQQVVFGTSGHRGSSFDGSFTETHVLAICQAICLYRKKEGFDGPLFIGIDTHALSELAFISAMEVFSANGVVLMKAAAQQFTPTPAVSHAILHYNLGRRKGLADGVIITPSHNPPESGGIKYNPPNGGPANTQTTSNAYAFIFDQQGFMAGVSIEGIKISIIDR